MQVKQLSLDGYFTVVVFKKGTNKLKIVFFSFCIPFNGVDARRHEQRRVQELQVIAMQCKLLDIEK